MPDQAPPTGAPTGNPGAPVPATSPLDVNGPGELYVIFHGLFCFFDPPDSDTIVCQLPFIPMQMGGMGGMDGMQSMGFPSSDHVYRAGNFLAETELASGYYTLAGVKRGSKHFDRKNNLVIGAERPAEGTHFPAYATINVPRPEEIYSVNNIPLPTAADGTKVGFEGPDKGLVSGDFYATAHVFKYFYGDSATLKLAGPVKSLDHDWSTEKGNTIIKNDTTLSCSLHIIAEPDHLMVGHVGRAFSASMGLLQKSDSTTPDIQYQEIPAIACGSNNTADYS